MDYHYSTTLKSDFDSSIEKLTRALAEEGFGIVSDIDVKATMKKKLDLDFRNYRIIGACNPPSALKAIETEHRIGVFLPCNVVVQEIEAGTVEVSAVNPLSSMGSINRPELMDLARDINGRLQRVIAGLG